MLTDAQRRALKPGDVVTVRDDFGEVADWTVGSAPWRLGHGEWVIGLEGKAGGYLLDRVTALVRPAGAPAMAPYSLQDKLRVALAAYDAWLDADGIDNPQFDAMCAALEDLRTALKGGDPVVVEGGAS